MSTPHPLGGEFDVTAGDPPVPLATWRTPRDPGAVPGAVPAALAARLCAAYSRAGDLVVDAIGEPAVAAAAGAYGRRPLRIPAAALAHVLPVEQQPLAALLLMRWPPDSERAPLLTVDLVLAGAWWLVRRGGCLAVLADSPIGGGPADLAGIVEAAAQAGLRYLQHVVAIDADVVGDQLRTTTVPVPPAWHARAHRDVLVFTRPGDHETDHR